MGPGPDRMPTRPGPFARGLGFLAISTSTKELSGAPNRTFALELALTRLTAADASCRQPGIHWSTTICRCLPSRTDRYLASTLVLQRLDGVPLPFLLDINRHVPNPDLAVILTATPDAISERISRAGVTHRFRGDPEGPKLHLLRELLRLL